MTTLVVKEHDSQADAKEWILEREFELRVECDFDSITKFKLIAGKAEIFGTEIAVDVVYELRGENIAIFTWHGCKISIWGSYHGYLATDTPMSLYMNVHGTLQRARETKNVGPRVLIAGPADSGKSSFAKILTAYCARQGGQCMYVDLDPGQGLPIPGSISAIPIVRPYSIIDGFDPVTPLTFFFGHPTPSKNPKLYQVQIEQLSKAVDERLGRSEEMKKGGVIINTCGNGNDGDGSPSYGTLKSIIEIMGVNVVLVMDNDRLYAEMKGNFEGKAEVVKIPKSGGVVSRDDKTRRKLRENKIRQYFYGVKSDLCPQTKSVNFSEISIYQIGGGPQAPLSALPIGAQSTHDPLRLSVFSPNSTIGHSILAISHAKSQEEILRNSVAGFICVTEIHSQKKKIDLLCPCSDPLPGKNFILGTLKYLE